MAKCQMCRCKATHEVFNEFKVCRWCRDHDTSEPCPKCSTIFDIRMTYTSAGRMMSSKVERRQTIMSGVRHFERNGDLMLKVVSVKELTHGRTRQSVVMITTGQQVGDDYYVTQWASEWERFLMEAAQPTLALAPRIWIAAFMDYDAAVLAGTYRSAERPCWPIIDVQDKVTNVASMLERQALTPMVLTSRDEAARMWIRPLQRNVLWDLMRRDVVELSLSASYIDWPKEPTDEEQN